jgi:hypothetical protein
MKHPLSAFALSLISILSSCASRTGDIPLREEGVSKSLRQSPLVIPSPWSASVRIDPVQHDFLAEFVGVDEEVVAVFGPTSEEASNRSWTLGNAGFRYGLVTSDKRPSSRDLTGAEFLELIGEMDELIEGQTEGQSEDVAMQFQDFLKEYFAPSAEVDYSGVLNYGTVFSGPDRYGFLVNFLALGEEGPVGTACVFSVALVNGQVITLKLFEGNAGGYLLQRHVENADKWSRSFLDANQATL